jgi:tRNA-2-methylthio-N6-dimethylallyladenosine synthase
MPSVYFETFGCQMNVADSDMLAAGLASRGFYTAVDSVSADLVVVNTCSVRENAEVRARARIREYIGQRKKHSPHQQVWVIGCMAQRLGESLKKELPGVDRVIGAQELVAFTQDIDHGIGNINVSTASGVSKAPVSTFIPIMRGCNNFCSYCIVPYVRGRETSIPAATIEEDIYKLVERGTKEFTLLGQNVNSYCDGTVHFPELLEILHAIPGLLRIRFTTSHPKDCTDALIDVMARLPKLCKHMHLPVQSGSSRILAAMNRQYTREDYLNRIAVLRSAMPGIDITTDVMVGFPGETHEDYLETLSLFKQVRFTTAFMFAYSARSGTLAAGMDGEITHALKKERLSELIALQTGITKEYYDAMPGRTISALFTEKQRGRDRLWMGQDNGCKRVLLACDDAIAGTILPVRVIKSTGMTLVCERK